MNKKKQSCDEGMALCWVESGFSRGNIGDSTLKSRFSTFTWVFRLKFIQKKRLWVQFLDNKKLIQ